MIRRIDMATKRQETSNLLVVSNGLALHALRTVTIPAEAAWEREWVPDDVLLFRYSALTFNGHRIHYDRRYATAAEGYAGLVVHGPLVSTLLLDLLRRELPERTVERFRFRGLRPTFDTSPFTVEGYPIDIWDAQVQVSTAQAASSCNAAIYALGDNGQPDELIHDFGIVSSATTGSKSFGSPARGKRLEPGHYMSAVASIREPCRNSAYQPAT